MPNISAVIFDLDNVLYDERKYLLAAYRNIAKYLSEHYNIGEQKIYHKLAQDSKIKTTMYPKLFNDLLSDLDMAQEVLPILLDIFSNTQTDLKLRATAKELILYLKKQDTKLGLLTNGTIKVQINKVRILGLEKYFDEIVYARELGKENEKPNPEAYLTIIKKLGAKPEQTICIGDNPYTDFRGAKKLGIQTVRLVQGEFKNVKLSEEYEADKNVRSLKEFYLFLQKLNRTSL